MKNLWLLGLSSAVLLVLAACAGMAGGPGETLRPLVTQTCEVFDRTTERVTPDVRLTYDSAFRCTDAPSRERYTFTVTVTNDGSSAAAATLENLVLRFTTPRPRGASPDATGEASGLPLTLVPGESGSFEVNGAYELVSTDEGGKANLHFHARGTTREPFNLGLNAHLRGTGAEEGDDGPPQGGGPGGPPGNSGGEPPPQAGPS